MDTMFIPSKTGFEQESTILEFSKKTAAIAQQTPIIGVETLVIKLSLAFDIFNKISSRESFDLIY